MSNINVPAIKAKVTANVTSNGINDISGAELAEIYNDLADSSVNKTTDAALLGVSEYNPTRTYLVGQSCLKDGYIYQALVQTTGTFASGDWNRIVLTVASVGALINGATAATPNDADLVATSDSSVLKKITWANVKTFFKTYFDTFKDASGGYAGLTLFKINFKNAANTFTSFLTNSNTAARTYTFQDRNGTIADNTDISGAISTANAYADSLVVGLWDDRGNFTPSGSFPSTGGSGSAGAIIKGDIWTISGLGSGVTGTMGAVTVEDGDTVRALVNTPGSTDSNWAIGNVNVTTVTMGSLLNSATSKSTPADADMVGLMDSAASNIVKKLSWLNIKLTLLTFFNTQYLQLVGGRLIGLLSQMLGTDIASASVDLGAATGNSVTITGTTTITNLGNAPTGTVMNVTFSGSLQLTHNGTSQILPNATNIQTQAGDTAIFVSIGTNQWRCIHYQYKFGTTAGTVLQGNDSRVTTGQIVLTAAGAWTPFTNGASGISQIESPTNYVNYFVVDFVQSTKSYAGWNFALPSDYNGGTITATFYWLANSSSTASVVWGIEGRAFANGDAIDQAFGAYVEETHANSSTANKVRISHDSAAITLGGSPAASQHCQIRVYRLGSGSDTLDAVARLLSVKLTYTRA